MTADLEVALATAKQLAVDSMDHPSPALAQAIVYAIEVAEREIAEFRGASQAAETGTD